MEKAVETLNERVTKMLEGDPGWIGNKEQRIHERVRQIKQIATECAELAASARTAQEADRLIRLRFEIGE